MFVLFVSFFVKLSLASTPLSLPQGKASIPTTRKRFSPHITSNAITRYPWKLAFERPVGGNLNTSILLNALVLAVHDRVEVGTVPLLFADDLYTVTLKYNFWRSERFNWSLGLATYKFSILLEPDSPLSNIYNWTLSSQNIELVLNYIPQWTYLKFGLTQTFASSSFRGSLGLSKVKSILEHDYEFGIDVSYPCNKNLDLTFGFGKSREYGIEARENMFYGFGISVTWYRPGKLFSSPNFGVHYSPKNRHFNFLYNTSFY